MAYYFPALDAFLSRELLHTEKNTLTAKGGNMAGLKCCNTPLLIAYTLLIDLHCCQGIHA